MKLSRKFYVVSALTLVTALGLSLTSGVTQPVPPPNGDTLKLTVFQVETKDCFVGKLSEKGGKVFMTGLSKHNGQVTVTVRNGQALLARGIIKRGESRPVKVEGFRTKGDEEPHEYIGHVTVVR